GKKKPQQKPVEAKTTKTPKKKPPVKELTVEDQLTDEDFESLDDRRTSPWLYILVAFVLACIGGMFYLTSRRKQLEAARANFREVSNHEVAFNSRAENLDMAPVSAQDVPTTGTLFGRAEASKASRARQRPARSSIFGRI